MCDRRVEGWRVEVRCFCWSVAAAVSYDKDAETVCLEFGSELGVGEVVISFNYTGTLNDQMRGFYRSKYTVDGEERYAAVTQFEVHHIHAHMTFAPHSLYHAGCGCSEGPAMLG